MPKQKQHQKNASFPRLTLAQVGRLLGTNNKGRLAGEIKDVVFIAIDCEAYEFAAHKTTEIGVSILDTAVIRNTEPGPKAAAWFNNMRCEHFRIKEFGKLRNKRFVKGDPDSFSFGSSTWIGMAEAKAVLNGIFESPGRTSSVPSGPRNIVLVGHALKNEVAYLNNLHFDLYNASNVVAMVDTQSIGPTKNELGLKKLCQVVGMEPQSLHNAGNDAAYTLRALVLATMLHDSTPTAFAAAFLPTKTVQPVPKMAEKAAGTSSQQHTQDEVASSSHLVVVPPAVEKVNGLLDASQNAISAKSKSPSEARRKRKRSKKLADAKTRSAASAARVPSTPEGVGRSKRS